MSRRKKVRKVSSLRPNLIVTSNDPIACVHALDDVILQRSSRSVPGVVDMVGFTRGVMNCKFHQLDTDETDLGTWVREDDRNFSWFMRYAMEVVEERGRRLKLLKARVIRPWQEEYCVVSNVYAQSKPFMVDEPPRKFLNQAWLGNWGYDFRSMNNVYEAYQDYMNTRWSLNDEAPRWTGRQEPIWADYNREYKKYA